MRRTAGFHDHGCGRLTCKKDGQLISRQPVVLVDMTRTMRDSNFKNGLRHIDRDGRILHGTPPDVWFLRTDRDDFGTSMPLKSPGGVHFISCAAGQRPGEGAFGICPQADTQNSPKSWASIIIHAYVYVSAESCPKEVIG